MRLIKVSVIITTLNEAENLPRCLAALTDFVEVIIVDAGSTDETRHIAAQYDAIFYDYQWNGAYPKKRQWCLDNIQTKHDYIFFVDADEEVTTDLVDEIKNLDFQKSGYFVKGRYCWDNKTLQYGLQNNKLVLFHRQKFEFPVIDDLYDFSMGEIEGHYQPVLKEGGKHYQIGQLNQPLNHFAHDNRDKWYSRHQRYAAWEAGMITNKAYPKEVSPYRQALKDVFRQLPCRGVVAFVHCYILKLGFLDGRAGFNFAQSRWIYYQMVSAALKTNKA